MCCSIIEILHLTIFYVKGFRLTKKKKKKKKKKKTILESVLKQGLQYF